TEGVPDTDRVSLRLSSRRSAAARPDSPRAASAVRTPVGRVSRPSNTAPVRTWEPNRPRTRRTSPSASATAYIVGPPDRSDRTTSRVPWTRTEGPTVNSADVAGAAAATEATAQAVAA